MSTLRSIMPDPWFTGLDVDGDPVSNGWLYVYDSGTSTLADIWTTSAGSVPQANPAHLDGAGRAVVYVDPAKTYTFRLEDALHNLVRESPGVPAIPASSASLTFLATVGEDVAAGDLLYLSDGSGGKTAGLWYKAIATASYASLAPTLAFATTAALQNAATVALTDGTMALVGPLTIGATYYVSGALAGAITSARPGTGKFVRRVGQAAGTLALLVSANPPTGDQSFAVSNNILASQSFGG